MTLTNTTTEAASTTPIPRPVPATFGRPVHGITARGAFVVMAVPAAIGCVLGFLLSGAVGIPTLAGWGLLLGSLVAAWKASPRLGWFTAFLPPLAMLSVVAVLGQVAIIGSRPTVVRELALVVAGLAATAPAQLASVAAVAGLIAWRRRRGGSGPRSD